MAILEMKHISKAFAGVYANEAGIPAHTASLNEDYLRLEEMALHDKQERAFREWLSKKIDGMYVYIDPEFRDGEFENKHWVK